MFSILAFFLFQAPPVIELPNVTRNPYTSSADLDWGKKLFAGRCAGCHGPTGDGGKGANLGVPVLPRAADDRSLYRVIRYGLPETEMPSTFLTEKEVWQIAAYVRTLGAVKRQSISGNPSHGRELVRGKGGCLQCHAVGADGGQMAPPLTDIGGRRSPAHLRAKLTDPASDIPDQFRLVSLTTRQGQKINGLRLNEDTWSIQVRDLSGKLYSFEKQNLTDLKVEKRSPMPSYKTVFDAQEMNDVIAYLAALRGEQ